MPGSSAGNVRSGWAGGGSACSSPGRRKVAGDTLCDAFMPLHPASNSATTGIHASRRTFQFSLTEAKYSLNYGIRNTNFEGATRGPGSADNPNQSQNPNSEMPKTCPPARFELLELPDFESVPDFGFAISD